VGGEELSQDTHSVCHRAVCHRALCPHVAGVCQSRALQASCHGLVAYGVAILAVAVSSVADGLREHGVVRTILVLTLAPCPPALQLTFALMPWEALVASSLSP
jgi:hypothetical protein